MSFALRDSQQTPHVALNNLGGSENVLKQTKQESKDLS
jgi:hypothetical protein